MCVGGRREAQEAAGAAVVSEVMSHEQLVAVRPYHVLRKAEDMLSNAQKSQIMVLDDTAPA